MSMHDFHPFSNTRREFLFKSGVALGGLALNSLGFNKLDARTPDLTNNMLNALGDGILRAPHIAPKAKRVIYLFQSGGPSQLDLFDYKPLLNKKNGLELPSHIRGNQRITGMTSKQNSLPLAGTHWGFKKYGQSGAEFSSLLPHMASVADDFCIIKSMWTDQINHDPALTFMQTGHQLSGRPCMGAWISYGLGSENRNLPTFTVLLSRGTGRPGGQPVLARFWGSGFLPSVHQGVRLRSAKDPVLYLTNPNGVHASTRRNMLDLIKDTDQNYLDQTNDPEAATRIAQYEMAYRMQTSVPEVSDFSDEPDYIFDMYGPEAKKPGTYAANCIMARRLAERDVKFIQLYHQGWDQHFTLPRQLKGQTYDTDQPTAALIKDLKMRGLLDDTLIIWTGEFGRTNYSQGKLTKKTYGRDHHPRCFTSLMAGGGVKAGMTYGRTDDYGYNLVNPNNPDEVIEPDNHKLTPGVVSIHDLNATIMHLLGIDHKKLTYRHQGLDNRLTSVHGHVIKDLIA